MEAYTSCPHCDNNESGETIYECRACGRVCCSKCANPEDSEGNYALSTCTCGADSGEYQRGRLFDVVGHICTDTDEDEASEEDTIEELEEEDSDDTDE